MRILGLVWKTLAAVAVFATGVVASALGLGVVTTACLAGLLTIFILQSAEIFLGAKK